MKKVHLIFMLLIGFGCISYAQTVTIGKQVWMTKNLDVSTFRNGDPIPEAKTDEEWAKAGENKQPAWCYYDNDPANGAKYGKLYNWYAVNDPRGLAPVGYHIPADKEWNILLAYLGGEYFAGKKMKSSSGWKENGNGTDESGFSGFPGGKRYPMGLSAFIGEYARWWSSSEHNADSSGCIRLENNHIGGFVDGTKKGTGYTVRCLRD
jgi:uncharacterized protein (TIGR02145 family)